MERSPVLKVERRERTGSKSAAQVRKEGRIPAVVYGHKKEPMAVSLDAHSFVQGLHHGHRLFDVQTGRKKEKMLVKDLQYDYLGKTIIHADLVRVDVTETVRVTVPIELKGTAKGAHEGGIVEAHSDHLEVECKVTDIPESIVLSVKELEVGDTLHAKDVVLPDGVMLVSDPSLLIATCGLVAAAKTTEELEAEAPAAPEVIAEAKEEEEEIKGKERAGDKKDK
jgi:large subunit ribosomal protein L25